MIYTHLSNIGRIFPSNPAAYPLSDNRHSDSENPLQATHLSAPTVSVASTDDGRSLFRSCGVHRVRTAGMFAVPVTQIGRCKEYKKRVMIFRNPQFPSFSFPFSQIGVSALSSLSLHHPSLA